MRQLITIEPSHRYCLSAGDSTRGYYLCEVRTTGTRRMVYVSHEGGSKATWGAVIRAINAATITGLATITDYRTSAADYLAVQIEPSRERGR